MEVTWVGHATVRLEMAGTTLLTDPVLRSRIFGLVRRGPAPGADIAHGVDAVLISHAHHDHLDLPSLRLIGRDVPMLVPRGAGRLLTRLGFREVTEMRPGDLASLGAVSVRAVPARHDGRRLPYGPSALALGYVIEGPHNVYFAGDTGLFPEMADIGGDLDLALLPVGGWGPRLRGGHLDPAAAAEALTLLQPRRALPIHWGTFWPAGMGRIGADRFSEPGREFAMHTARVAPEVEVAVLATGDRWRLPDR